MPRVAHLPRIAEHASEGAPAVLKGLLEKVRSLGSAPNRRSGFDTGRRTAGATRTGYTRRSLAERPFARRQVTAVTDPAVEATSGRWTPSHGYPSTALATSSNSLQIFYRLMSRWARGYSSRSRTRTQHSLSIATRRLRSAHCTSPSRRPPLPSTRK